MANFDSGVSGYVKAAVTVYVNFPIDIRGRAAVACVHCPYLSSNMRMCQLNKEPVAYPEKFVGDKCPLEEIKEEV